MWKKMLESLKCVIRQLEQRIRKNGEDFSGQPRHSMGCQDDDDDDDSAPTFNFPLVKMFDSNLA